MIENIKINQELLTNEENVNSSKHLIMKLDQYFLAVEVTSITDVLFPQKITHIPLSPPYVLGAFNLRGQIVTVLDLRIILDLENKTTNLTSSAMVVVSHEDELMCFIVDQANHVIDIDLSITKDIPGNIPQKIRSVTDSITFFNDDLLLILNKEKIIGTVYA